METSLFSGTDSEDPSVGLSLLVPSGDQESQGGCLPDRCTATYSGGLAGSVFEFHSVMRRPATLRFSARRQRERAQEVVLAERRSLRPFQPARRGSSSGVISGCSRSAVHALSADKGGSVLRHRGRVARGCAKP